MIESIYEVAGMARKALCRMRPQHAVVRVVSLHCEICGKTHRMGLGSPRCTAPVNLTDGSERAERAIFGRALAAVLAAACLGLSGCTHFYVSGVTVGAGATGDGKELTAGLTISPNPYSYKAVIPLLSK